MTVPPVTIPTSGFRSCQWTTIRFREAAINATRSAGGLPRWQSAKAPTTFRPPTTAARATTGSAGGRSTGSTTTRFWDCAQAATMAFRPSAKRQHISSRRTTVTAATRRQHGFPHHSPMQPLLSRVSPVTTVPVPRAKARHISQPPTSAKAVT